MSLRDDDAIGILPDSATCKAMLAQARHPAVPALESIIEWTEDSATRPIDPRAQIGWYERRLLMIRNAARAALQKMGES